MKKLVLRCLLLLVVFLPCSSHGAALPVVDLAAIAQLIQQVRQTLQVIQQLQQLNEWSQIDHINLSASEFTEFLGVYSSLFETLINEIEGYQNGGLLGQIERLDEVYFPYYDDWESQGANDFTVEADPYHAKLKKQLLWTRIQLKHAAKVAARVREELPKNQVQLQTLLAGNFASPGMMQTVKIGNEISAMVARSLETLNTQMGEFLQAHAAEGLERNTREGLQKNRAREAISDWGLREGTEQIAPLNPFGAY